MQLPRLSSGVPRYVLNTGLAIFILSIVLWSINALSIGSIDILRGKSTQPLQLGDTSDEAHNLNSTLDPNLESHSNHHLLDPDVDQELDPVDPDRNQPQIEDGHEHQTEQSSSTTAAASNATAITTDRRCNAIANPPDVAIIVKTGANVLYEKVPFQLLSSWLCADDPLIFSDLATTLGPYQVYDVLDNVTDAVKQSSDFDYYRRLQDYKKYGQDVRKLRSEGESGWTLDKYKFIPMLKKTWTMRPNHDWYVFLEGDTYLMWTNMLLWLQQLNPHDLHYLGEQTYVNNEGFAHGGSGFIISRAAMAKVLDDDPDITHRYDFIAMNEYYGDYVLAKALKEKGVELGLYKPMLQGEPPSTLRYGPGRYENERAWCQPLITLHHVTPLDVDAVWQFEQQREDLTQPILFADMYRYFMAAHLPEDGDELLLEDWDNFSEDAQLTGPESEEEERPIPPEEMTPAQQEAHESAEKCAAACAEYPRCMQFSYEASEQKCSYSFSYRLGQRRDPQDDDDKKYTSGWIRSKIDRDIMEHPCESVEWRGFDTE